MPSQRKTGSKKKLRTVTHQREPESQTCPTIEIVPLDSIRPFPANDEIYRPIDPADPEFLELVQSIERIGVTTAIHVSTDGFINSGHRRFAAAKIAGVKTVPVIVLDISSDDPQFLKRLVECNRQRTKTIAEVAREVAATVDTTNAYAHLKQERERLSENAMQGVEVEELPSEKSRRQISRLKRPFLDAAVAVVNSLKSYWPLSVRQIHYRLLNTVVLKNANDPKSRYANDLKSYKDLCEILARGRLAGNLPMESISDDTRPFTQWNTHRNPESFITSEIKKLFLGYWRDLLQSQPNQIELVGEKLTVEKILKRAAAEYCVSVSIGKGYAPLDVRHKMVQRFKKSGKEKLVILYVSDFDPEGRDMPTAFARSLRDDFGIEEDRIQLVRVALNPEQISELNLPPMMKAKKDSSRYEKFAASHGDDVYELEAVPPETLQQFVSDAILSVLDVDAFNEEHEREEQDAKELERRRQVAIAAVAAA